MQIGFNAPTAGPLSVLAPPGTYTWIPFGGGTRRCLGASFSMFEMKHVLRAVVGARRVTAIAAADEGYARRGVTFVPADDTPLLLQARKPARSAAALPG